MAILGHSLSEVRLFDHDGWNFPKHLQTLQDAVVSVMLGIQVMLGILHEVLIDVLIPHK